MRVLSGAGLFTTPRRRAARLQAMTCRAEPMVRAADGSAYPRRRARDSHG
jgi:hypothetical protein